MSCTRIVGLIVLFGATILAIAEPAWAKGYSYEGGAGGATRSFYLTGGDYELNLVADRPQDWLCLFSGSLDRVAPVYSISLGTAITLDKDDWKPWEVDHYEALPAGQYTLRIPVETTCNWSFRLVPTAGPQSSAAVGSKFRGKQETEPCCLANVTMLKNPIVRPTRSKTASISDLVLLTAPFVSKSGIDQPGMCEIRVGDTVIKEDVLQVRRQGLHGVFYIYVQWNGIGVRDRGKITVRFHTPMGDSIAKFRLTN